MKKVILVVTACILLLGFSEKATAQYYFYDNNSYNNDVVYELGGALGIMNSLTDIGGRKGVGKPFLKDLNMGKFQFNGGLYLSATYKEKIALRLEGTWGKISAHDSILKDVASTTSGRYERNLNFRSKISEVSLIAEFHPLFIFIDWAGRDQDPPRLSPYLAAGIGYFSFNPQAKNRDGKYVDLQPLSTEGQGYASYPDRLPYKLSQFNVPLGIGIRYELGSNLNFRAEILHRTTFTDYIDDVSTRYIDPTLFSTEGGLSGTDLRDAIDLSFNNRTNPLGSSGPFRKTPGGIRGNPKDNDAYFTFNFKLGFTFGRQRY
jgi:Domain of unknown function (DUF6089)